MTKLSERNRYYRTTNATATAADIALGKTAYIAGGQATGTLVPPPSDLSGDGTILFWNMGVGASGVYVPDVADAEYADGSVSIISNGLTWSRDGNGYLFTTNSSSMLFGSPAKSGVCREYRASWAETNPSPNQFHQAGVILNYQDTDNYWYVRYMRNTTTTWSMEILQRSGGSDTGRGSVGFTSTIDPPGSFIMNVQDWGNVIFASVIAVDGSPPSAAAEIESKSVSYYVASRALQTEPNFGLFNNFTDYAGISNFHVRDVIAPA